MKPAGSTTLRWPTIYRTDTDSARGPEVARYRRPVTDGFARQATYIPMGAASLDAKWAGGRTGQPAGRPAAAVKWHHGRTMTRGHPDRRVASVGQPGRRVASVEQSGRRVASVGQPGRRVASVGARQAGRVGGECISCAPCGMRMCCMWYVFDCFRTVFFLSFSIQYILQLQYAAYAFYVLPFGFLFHIPAAYSAVYDAEASRSVFSSFWFAFCRAAEPMAFYIVLV